MAFSAVACTVDSGTTPTPGNPNPGTGGSSTGGQTTTSGGTTVIPGAGTASMPVAGTGTVTTGGSGTTGGTGTVTGGTGTTGGTGVTGGTAPTGGTGNDNGMDSAPPHPLAVDPASAASKQFTFNAKQLDPMAGTSTPDTNAGSQEFAMLDAKRPKIQGKLVLTMGGIGTCCGQGGIGGFAVGLGFHHMGIAMLTTNSALPDSFKDTAKNMPDDMEANRQMGDGRMEAWDGKDRVSWLNINEHDSFAYRTAMALKYMVTQDPGGDWGYFLNADGSVRWSDVYLVGYSYGSQTLAVVGKYVRIGRGIATSGPVDEGFPNATWIKAASATPLERMFGLYGSSNLDTKVQTATAAGWLGPPVTVNGGATTADLMMGHQFILQGQGHSEFCAGDGGQWKALCQYSFGVMQ
jgi:hypothetical protein